MKINLLKKSLILTIVILFIFSSCTPLTGLSTYNKTAHLLSNSNNEDTYVEIVVNEPDIIFGTVQYDEGIFSTLEIPKMGYTTIEGEAKLPLIRYMVNIPQNATPESIVTAVSWEHVSLNEINLPIRITPVQPYVEKTDQNPDFVINDEYYSKSEFMQTDIVRIVETGEIRGHRFALLEISPVQYKPSTGELKIMTSCDIHIDLLNSDLVKTSEILSKYSNPAFEDLFETLFINPYNWGDKGNTTNNQDGYLIIVYDDFYEEILPLAIWKETIGFNVTVQNTSQIPGGPTNYNIYNYIKEAYTNWTIPPSYILLVGDTGQIPTYIGTESSTATDLEYVKMNDNDYFPDIFIGRFPAQTESHVTAMVDKVLYYEQGNFVSNDWIKKAVFMAGNDHYYLTEATHSYVISNYLTPNNFICDKLYEVSYGATTQDVKNSFNNGRNLAVFSGHGAVTYWDDGPRFYQSDVNSLTNQDMYPFVCSHACKTGTFDYNECFGETIVRAENKAGLAFWGSSHNTYWDPDDILEKKMFEAWWVDNLETIGGMTDMGLYYHYLHQGGAWPSELYFECYNILGDPSIKIWRDTPNVDNNPPEIQNIIISPPSQDIGGSVNISCNATDYEAYVDTVKLNITYPNGSFNHQIMTRIGSSYTYYYNTTYSIPGEYDFYISANDTNNNLNISDIHSFTIGTLLMIADIDHGWNFISIPFNKSVDKYDITVKNTSMNYTWDEAVTNGWINPNIFGWDRFTQSYLFADKFEPGYGYWIFANGMYQILAYEENTTINGNITDIEPNWNIIGLPISQHKSKTDIVISYNGTDYLWADAVTNGFINNNLFGWDGTGQHYIFSDSFEPGYAYWLYAYYSCRLKQ